MGAAPVHLDKLDAIQRRAARVGRFEMESLASRREAAAVAFTLKLPDGGCRGVLKQMTSATVPTLVDNSNRGKRTRDSRHLAAGVQLACRAEATSLDVFKRGSLGSIHLIFDLEETASRISEARHGTRMAQDKEILLHAPH